MTDKHSFLSKTILMFLLIFSTVFFLGSVYGQETVDQENLAQKSYDQAIKLLMNGQFTKSKKAMNKALELASQSEVLSDKSLEGLALIEIVEAQHIENHHQQELDRNRNTILYGVVILIFAGILLSFLLRFGPQRPKVIDKAEAWVEKSHAASEKDAPSQALTSFFSLLIFAMAAFGILAIALLFLWLLSSASGSPDSELAKVDSHYKTAAQFLSKRKKDDDSIKGKTELLGFYKEFLLDKGMKREAALIDLKLNNLKRARKFE